MEYVQVINLVWERKIDFYQLLEIISRYEKEKLFAQAATLYQIWIERNDSVYNAVAYFNLGVIYFSIGEYENAARCYENVQKINPKFLQSWVNLGLVRERQGLWDQACAAWKQVEEGAHNTNEDCKAILISSFNNIARLQERRKIYDEANLYLNKSLALDASQEDVLHHLVFVRARQCLWPVYEAPEGVNLELMKASTSALAMIALSDDPLKQLDAATRYATKKAPLERNILASQERYEHAKIRIGYCSSDFSLHPVSMLVVEMLELHNRDKFEVYGFCWSPNDGSDLRQRVVDAFDHYIPIGGLDDESAAKKIRELEIDVLIDLQGQTAGARMNMLAWRPAPIQVTYLGLPATTGMPSIDYVIADKYLIPEESSKFYSEKMIYMPDVYQVSDRQRTHNPVLSRQDYGLPENKFIYCSFNNNYKYTFEVFSSWMNILKRVPDSVLWLLADNPIAAKNLLRQAEILGVDSQRIIFSERAAPADYLSKYLIADLFLDTFPFNAGTTANDALWMGLPVLTMSGQAFASRMAGALLTAAGVPELITNSLTQYEDKAVSLARDVGRIKELRQVLNEVKENGVLFDTPKFVKNLENRLEDLVGDLPLCTNFEHEGQASDAGESRIDNLMEVVKSAEQLISSGDKNSAVELYKNYLRLEAPHDIGWMANFNLAVLLNELQQYDDSRRQFEITLEKNPGFENAHLALKILSEQKANTPIINLYSIAWNEELKNNLPIGFKLLDNSKNLRPDWMEYWAIRNFWINNSTINDEDYYGFFSPKFEMKTGLAASGVEKFIQSNPGKDVYIFSPQPDMGGFFINTVEQAELFDQGFKKTFEELMQEIGISWEDTGHVMDSREVVFSNYIVARPSFWRRWVTVCEQVFDISENTTGELREKINFKTTYPGEIQRKVFIIERIASVLLRGNEWTSLAYDTFKCAWSGLPTAQYKHEAVMSDALKMAFNTTKNEVYLSTYFELRSRVFGNKES